MIGIVIAKEPVPGRAKTRLCPPCEPAEAAAIAEAALADTLDAVAVAPFDERVLVLAGRRGPWLPAGFRVVPQRGDGLGERLAAAFADVVGPALLVGMDTPQVTSSDLAGGAARLADPSVDAVLGLAADGGWWAIGLSAPDPAVFGGIPMSTATTGARQLRRLRELGCRVAHLPTMRDVDTFDDAIAVAASIPGGRFGSAVREVAARHAAAREVAARRVVGAHG